jgi:hypothetical protein
MEVAGALDVGGTGGFAAGEEVAVLASLTIETKHPARDHRQDEAKENVRPSFMKRHHWSLTRALRSFHGKCATVFEISTLVIRQEFDDAGPKPAGRF